MFNLNLFMQENGSKQESTMLYSDITFIFSWQQYLNFRGTENLEAHNQFMCSWVKDVGYIWSPGHVVAAGKVCWNSFCGLSKPIVSKFPPKFFLNTFNLNLLLSKLTVIHNIRRNEWGPSMVVMVILQIFIFRSPNGIILLSSVEEFNLKTTLISSEWQWCLSMAIFTHMIWENVKSERYWAAPVVQDRPSIYRGYGPAAVLGSTPGLRPFAACLPRSLSLINKSH